MGDTEMTRDSESHKCLYEKDTWAGSGRGTVEWESGFEMLGSRWTEGPWPEKMSLKGEEGEGQKGFSLKPV